jgi:ATP-binding cassette subfamily B multidrug efflux pump
VLIYFVTMLAVVGGFDLAAAALPGLAGAVRWLTLRHFVPRLAAWRKAQADARSLMTGRITDAYTNIATVKLFSHAQREAGFARGAMQEFLDGACADAAGHGFEIVNQACRMG